MRCKGCEYYSTGYFSHVDNGEVIIVPVDGRAYGMCLYPKVACDNIDDWLNRKFIRATDTIYAGCDENRGYLEVGEDFGCIHFKEK